MSLLLAFTAGIAATLFTQARLRAAEERSRMLPAVAEHGDALRRALFASVHVRREGRQLLAGVLRGHR